MAEIRDDGKVEIGRRILEGIRIVGEGAGQWRAKLVVIPPSQRRAGNGTTS
jgi:hypothetical protein